MPWFKRVLGTEIPSPPPPKKLDPVVPAIGYWLVSGRTDALKGAVYPSLVDMWCDQKLFQHHDLKNGKSALIAMKSFSQLCGGGSLYRVRLQINQGDYLIRDIIE